MRISNHGAHLVQLTRWATAFPMNCYLVVEDDGLTLVDSTMSSPAPDVGAVVSRMGAELRRIVLTHAHGDHVGGVAGMRQRFPGLEIAIGEREGRILAGDKSLDPGEPQGSIKGFFEKVDWRPDRLLRPGDRVGSLEVVPSPGHTPGHLAFLDVRDRTLVAGDAFQTRGGMAVSGVIRPLFPFPALATWHKPTALATAITLQELRPKCLAVGHGDLLEDPGAAIAVAVEAARKAFG